MRLSHLALALTLGSALVAQAPATPPVIDADALEGLRARNIGPAVMSGRISAMDGFLDKGRVTLYAGAASGGVWKSTNGGTTYKPVFDKHNQCIGAIRVHPKTPSTVWVGTGEPWVRNSVSAGDGVYRTTDGGENWTHLGLKETERIAGIEVHPTISDIAYVAAQGALWNANPERGLYRTKDGGKTWQKILFVDNDTGCASIAMDPSNPNVLFAAMWQHRRQAWSFSSGGKGSGLYKSTDGGDTWTKLTGDPKRGLPEGDLGRIALTISPSSTKTVYAVVEAKKGGLYRSEDGGETWTRGNAGANIIIRPFYFALVVPDPKDPKRVYKPGLQLSVSDDGGQSFTTIAGSTHSDHHALWINPSNTEQLFLGTDGGVFESNDRGNTWRMHGNLPLSQYYHVAVDMERPYRVFGGLQDNSSWMGYSSIKLGNKHWSNLNGGDGFWVQPDPSDPDYAYAESQGGNMVRVNLRTMISRPVKPEEGAGEVKYRWNWSTPIVLSPNEKGTFYTACQYLFRTRDKGNSWERISPDLTTNDTKKQKQEDSGGITVDNSSAETHCTIYTVSESPKNPRVIWAGTDDGNLQLTRDGGKSWKNTAVSLPGLPKGTWVSWVEASSHMEGTAFATFDGHTSGDMKSYVYRTDDFGQTWKPLATPDLTGFAHVVKQDPVRADLLYLGTDEGLFLSLDAGAHWVRFKGGNFPRVPVRDLAIHPRENDLVLATHGRGLWIIDDLTPLRALAGKGLEKDIALLPTRPGVVVEAGGDGWMDGDSEFTGEGPVNGVVVAYWQKKRHLFGDFKAEILDAEGRLIRTMPASKRRGLNYLLWDGTAKPPRVAKATQISYAGFVGPRLPEGTYTVRLTKNQTVVSGPITLAPDPDNPFTKADREARYQSTMTIFRMIEDMAFTVDQILVLRDGARTVAEKIHDAVLAKRLRAFADALDAERGKLVPTSEKVGITGEERLRERLASLYASVNGERGKPSKTQTDRVAALKADLAEVTKSYSALLSEDLLDLDKALQAAGQPALTRLIREAWE